MARVAQIEIDERRREITSVLRDRSYLPVSELCRRFKISEATARRDLLALSKQKAIVRTFGGAMADYDRRFIPFADRLKCAAAAKRAIAREAANLVLPGDVIFLDAGTTLFAVAHLLRKTPPDSVRVVTNSLAVAEILAGTRGIEIDVLGGRLLANQSVLLGDATCRAARFYDFDVAFLGAEGFDEAGVWNSTEDVVALQQTIVARSKRHAVCADATKANKQAPAFLLPWERVNLLITDAAEEVPGLVTVLRTTRSR